MKLMSMMLTASLLLMITACGSTTPSESKAPKTNSANINIVQNLSFTGNVKPVSKDDKYVYDRDIAVERLKAGNISGSSRNLHWFAQFIGQDAVSSIIKKYEEEMIRNQPEVDYADYGLLSSDAFKAVENRIRSKHKYFGYGNRPWQPGNGPRVVSWDFPEHVNVKSQTIDSNTMKFLISQNIKVTYFIYSLVGSNSPHTTTSGSIEVELTATAHNNSASTKQISITVSNVNITNPIVEGETILNLIFDQDVFLQKISEEDISIKQSQSYSPYDSYFSSAYRDVSAAFDERNNSFLAKWNAIGAQNWSASRQSNFNVGDEVCDMQNRIGNVEVVGDSKYKVWWQSRVASKTGFFFGNIQMENLNIRNPDRLNFNVLSVDDKSWISKTDVGRCFKVD